MDWRIRVGSQALPLLSKSECLSGSFLLSALASEHTFGRLFRLELGRRIQCLIVKTVLLKDT